jgi:hypothetical protein
MYIIVSEIDIVDFESAVDQRVRDGWTPAGGMVIMDHAPVKEGERRFSFYQSMTKFEFVVPTVEVKSETPARARVINLTVTEIQSGLSRVRWAENLISQLPANHEGRNSWLLNYGIGERAQALRTANGIKFVEETQSAETVGDTGIDDITGHMA